MTRKFAQVALALMLLSSPLVLWADSSLNYQDRGDRHEGLRPKPVSGYDIEVISVLADYQEPVTQLPDQLRVGFYLQSQAPVYLTVREQDYRLYYWLDKVKPAKGWQAESRNEYSWPTGPVLQQLDPKLNPYELGVLIRLGKGTPAENEDRSGGPLSRAAARQDRRLSVHDEDERGRAAFLQGSSRERVSRADDTSVPPASWWPAVHRAVGCGRCARRPVFSGL